MQSRSASSIVIVDDEPFILSAMSSLLRSAGYAVRTCNEWAGVATAVREAEPSLVLLDYNMPALKGDKLCEILKRNMAGDGMRVYIFSSEPEHDLVRIVAQSGADGYLKKNLPADELLRQVGEIIGTRAQVC